jgi:hypothetical protein
VLTGVSVESGSGVAEACATCGIGVLDGTTLASDGWVSDALLQAEIMMSVKNEVESL